MKEIKLWEIKHENKDGPPVKPLKSVKQTETENLLEEIIVGYPDLLSDGLKLVGRQTETPRGPLDLLAFVSGVKIFTGYAIIPKCRNLIKSSDKNLTAVSLSGLRPQIFSTVSLNKAISNS